MIQPIHEYYKAAAVQNCRLELGIDKGSSFSEKYTSVIKDSKEMGAVYTPAEISGYIIRNTISRGDIMQNPFLRIVDPACGTGNIILPCFLILEQIYSESLDEINEAHSLKQVSATSARVAACSYGVNLDGTSSRSLHRCRGNLSSTSLEKALFVQPISIFCCASWVLQTSFSRASLRTFACTRPCAKPTIGATSASFFPIVVRQPIQEITHLH